jgi:hypothetical protein
VAIDVIEVIGYEWDFVVRPGFCVGAKAFYGNKVRVREHSL